MWLAIYGKYFLLIIYSLDFCKTFIVNNIINKRSVG